VEEEKVKGKEGGEKSGIRRKTQKVEEQEEEDKKE